MSGPAVTGIGLHVRSRSAALWIVSLILVIGVFVLVLRRQFTPGARE